MAKNKIKATLEVDDKGNLKKLAKDSDKAGKGLDNVAKNARTADRNIKGAAQASSNGTKNFSKMAQGTGGLVGAYATLAANIFAITAAFNFLRSAADFRVVTEAQVAFSGATGQGMRSLTADIQAASESMLDFQASSEAAAIGIASGLGADQITDLAEGAANVSKILGRDVTDSFNRLVRGVTKAEPELLDELGITLRLADAQENFAAKLGRSAKTLSQFEKKQAVFNEVQSQLDEKFNNVAQAVDIQGNAINKLAVAFDEVLKPIKSFVSALAEPVAEFFSKNVNALAVTLGLLAIPLIKQIIPAVNNFAEKAEEAAERSTKAFQHTQKQIEKLAQARARASRDPVKAGQTALRGIDTTPGSGAAALKAGEQLNKRQLASMKRFALKNQGIVKQMSARQKRDYIAAIEAMIAGNRKLNFDTKRLGTQITTTFKITTNKMKVMWQSSLATMSRAAGKFGKVANKALGVLGLLGIFTMIFEVIKTIGKSLGIIKVDEEAQAYAKTVNDLTESLKESNKEFEKFAAIQEALRKRTSADGNAFFTERTIDGIEAMGKMLETVTPKIEEMQELLANPVEVKSQTGDTGGLHKDLVSILDAIGFTATKLVTPTADLTEAQKELRKNLDTVIAGLEGTGVASTAAGAQFLQLLEQQREGIPFTDQQAELFERLKKELIDAGSAATKFKQQNKEVTKQFTQQLTGLTKFKTSQTDLLNLLENQQNILKDTLTEEFEGRQDIIDQLGEQLRITKLLQEAEIGFAIESARNAAVKEQSLIGATKLQAAEINRQAKAFDIEIKRQKILKDMQIIAESGELIDPKQVEMNEQKLALLNAQAEALELQNDLSFQLNQNMANAFESGTQKGLADLIKGNEKSFKDAILKIAQATLNAAADTLAEQLTQGLTERLFGSPAQRMKRAMAEGGAVAAAQIKAALTGKAPATTDVVSSGLTTSTSTETSTSTGKTVEEVLAFGDSEKGIFGAFIDNLKGIFSQDTPFLKGLQGIFKGAFAGFKNIFAGLIDGLFGSSTTDGLFGFIGGLFGGASGGIMTPRGKMSGYSTGGIARGSQRGYPAILHGTEAVVPLPNGKSIPVEMNKNSQQTQNNIVVNVTADGRVSRQESSGPDMDQMGTAIAKAVQIELQNQKRSGGMLSPYGPA